MKKKLICIVLAIVMVVALVGCSNSGVSKEEYDRVVEERDDAIEKLDALQAEIDDMGDTPSATTNEEPTSSTPPVISQEPSIAALQDYAHDTAFFSYSGTGDDVVSGLNVENYSFLKVTHLGSGHFAIKAHHDDTYDLLLNTKDPYDGGRTLLFPNTEYTLEVSADNEWSVEAFQVGTSSSDSFSGNGDFVTPICYSTSDVYEIIADGSGHFAVKGYHEDGSYELLVNTTDPYSGNVMLNGKDELCFFEITGERSWTIKPK